MTARLLLLCAACALCASAAQAAGFRPVTDLRVSEAPAATAAVTLYWTMPRLKANGRPLSTAPLDWQAAYSTQSRTWVAHRWPIITDADSAAYYWPTVRAEAAPLVVMSGTAIPGAHVSIVPVPVQAWDWPYSFWVRTRQRPNGEWSGWSNPVSRTGNQ